MRSRKFDAFEISIMKERRSKQEFAVVAPSKLSDADAADVERKIRAYLDFHLAIKPNNAVILFQIQALAETGSPLFTLPGGQKLYHIPVSLYGDLENIVARSVFIVSHSLLGGIIDASGAYRVDASMLDEVHQSEGLTIIGLHGVKT